MEKGGKNRGDMPPAAFKMKHLVCSQQIHTQLHSASRPLVCNPCKPPPSSQAPWSAASTGRPSHPLSLTLSLGLPQSTPTFGIMHTLQLFNRLLLFTQSRLFSRIGSPGHATCSACDSDLSSGPAVLEVCSLALQHWHHHVTCYTCRFLALTLDHWIGNSTQWGPSSLWRPYCRLKLEKCCSSQMAPPLFAMCFSLPESLLNYMPKMKS